jgi:hypothetical protein
VDALQEFRIQTSTYAPEFGRTPGGQISIVTRSGTNDFHGTAFDYLRNDLFDANNWFANNAGLKKPEERQNDFGGTFSGPILKNQTFFFLSYEGLRLRLPQVALANVPDLHARQSALPAIRPLLNAFPLPNGSSSGTDQAQYNASFSNRATLDAYSLRIDHKLNDKLALFGRYNYSPSEILQRGFGIYYALSSVFPSRITTQTATIGATWSISPIIVDDIRVNFSRAHAVSYGFLDNFGGAVPLASLGLPTPYTSRNGNLYMSVFSLGNNGALDAGKNVDSLQRQINIVDSLSTQKGRHSLKFGVDFRRLSPVFSFNEYGQIVAFLDVPSAETGSLFYSFISSFRAAHLWVQNLGVFAQDTWRIVPRLTLTYGVRWDVDFSPSSNPSLPAVSGYNLKDLSHLALAAAGTPTFYTTYGNVAPRIGLAYQLSRSQEWQAVLRGGFGVFYDLVSSEVGNQIGSLPYPFGASRFTFGGSFPLDSATAAPPPISAASLSSGGLYSFDPNLRLPYSLEWNVALEQSIGSQQTISATYVGSSGRRLLQTATINSPNASFGFANLVGNTAASEYDALQLQFVRRLSRGIQALASYTWAHSIDNGSAGSYGNTANLGVPTLNANANRGPSDFDIRHAFSLAVTYQIPTPKMNALTKLTFGGWSLQSAVQVRSAAPVDVSDVHFFQFHGYSAAIRPDLVSGQPLYLYGTQYPGGKALNPKAFTDPPTDLSGKPLRQGNLGRNSLRGFGAAQWDFAVHREFPIHESFKLQFRAEMFNVVNHPNFGPPSGTFGRSGFGLSKQMLGASLSGSNLGGGGFDPLYQIGGPRSIQFALKLSF